MPDQSSAATEHAILAEITRPLESLPEDPLALVDADFPTALRGYDRGTVDDYVRKTRQLLAELQATRSPEAAVRRALERVGEQISGILQRAHETAEQITAQSRSEAEDRLEQARLEAAQIADAAEQRVRDLDADTDRIWLERQRIVADAEDLSGQLLALAKTAAERFPADAEAAAAGAAADDTEPVYDEAEDATLVAAERFGDEDPELDDPPEYAEPPGPEDRSEVERTLAFGPLADEGDDGGEGDGDVEAVPESEPEAGQPAEVQPGSTDDDSTAIIPPPASQAAHRRRTT
jgi:cell division septum initiation protein DivIVA